MKLSQKQLQLDHGLVKPPEGYFFIIQSSQMTKTNCFVSDFNQVS